MKDRNGAGPCILYLDARRAGAISGWNAWIERACALGCNWLWLADVAPRAAETHPLATIEPGALAPSLAGGGDREASFAKFAEAAHAAGLRLATDFAPSFVARASPLVRAHRGWFVAGPDGLPAVPGGLGESELAGSLVEGDFGGEARGELVAFWRQVATRIAGRGFDALLCRSAHRLPALAWSTILAPLRGKTAFWAETFGAPIELSEALAQVDFNAFFSSAGWWDFHAEWFLEQEARLRRMAPTIAFADPPDADAGADRTLFRYAFGAAAAWGVVLREPREAGPEFREKIAAINAMKRATPAFAEPHRLRRLTAPGARALVLAAEPMAGEATPALIALNSDPAAAAEVTAHPLFAALDARVAAAEELTPGRSTVRLDTASRLVLEPLSLRCFELGRPALKRKRRALAAPARPSDPVAIENVRPRTPTGDEPVKRVLGDALEVSADLVVEGHARPAALIEYRPAGAKAWRAAPFEYFDNDRWRGAFAPDRIGGWEFRLLAWRDRYRAWREATIKRRDAGQPLASELGEAEEMLAEALAGADETARKRLAEIETLLDGRPNDVEARADLLLSETTMKRIEASLPRLGLSRSPVFSVLVERARARAGAWYECFPRSLGEDGRHGNFDDLIRHLPYIAELGFDVVYLPPIHPIGVAHRKGKNNALDAGPHDPGSPWAIGAKEGGHTAIHPGLGTPADFRRLLAAAKQEGLEVALDFAIQCSRDHPWLEEHPEWFQWRPDGSIRYAENPPKKYQDIVNVDFYCAERKALWKALAEIVLFWCAEGVRIFRVDNPHTKPLPFWEWLLAEVRARYPDTLFLAEAFTRPKLMYRLAEIGFSQSYTYFVWRETKAKLIEYLEELTSEPVKQCFRPNFWVNTPDINPFYLHEGVRAAFVIRAVLAATLVPSWGLYSGYELCEHVPVRDDDGTAREEYLDAEKYELKPRDFDAPGNIRAEIAALNRIRHENPALGELTNLRFHPVHNDQVMFFSKRAPDNLLWIVVSLDPHGPQEADIELPLDMLEADDGAAIAVEDLFANERWQWRGRRQHVWLSPERPAQILRVSKG